MSNPANRSARRTEARKNKNRKNGMAALSLLATTGLMSSYVAAFRTTASFASNQTCAGYDLNLNYEIGTGRTQDNNRVFNHIGDLSDAIFDDAIAPNAGDSICVSITFDANDDIILNDSLDIHNKFDDEIAQVYINGNGVTLDGNDLTRILWIDEDIVDVSIDDVTFTEGAADNQSFNGDGGAIWADANLTITNSTFTHNVGTSGGAVFSYGDVSISDSSFENNYAFSEGGAIRSEVTLTAFLDSAGDPIDPFSNTHDVYFASGNGDVAFEPTVSISNTDFLNNESVSAGGAIAAPSYYGYVDYLDVDLGEPVLQTASGHVSIDVTSDSSFVGNLAGDEGGAIYADDDLTVSNSTFTENESNSGGGGAIYADDDLTVSNSIFSRNETSNVAFTYGGGGAIKADDDLTVDDSDFFDNLTGEGSGGAIDSDDDSIIRGSTFERNNARYDGGAIESDDDLTVENSTFDDNQASDEGGAIYAGYIGSVTNSTFTQNSSDEEGGAIFAYSDSDQGEWVVTGSDFYGNDAGDDGGAIYAQNDLVVSTSTFSFNFAEGVGGAVRLSSYGLIENSAFGFNYAYGSGGALRFFGDTTVVNSTFEMNASYAYGGAIRAAGGDDNALYFNTFKDNYSDVPTYNEDQDPNWVRQSRGEAFSSYEGATLIGNIFANEFNLESQIASTEDQIHIQDQTPVVDFQYNLSTGSDFEIGSTNQTVDFADLLLADEGGENGGPTPTVALLSGMSIAADFVPASFSNLVTFEGSGGLLPRDQRGVARSGALDAGSFEVGVSTRTEATPATFVQGPPFNVLDSSPIKAIAGRVVQATGVNLTRVTEVYVNGIKVEITSRAGSSLSFRAPAGMTGFADIRFVGAGHEVTLTAALNFGAPTEVSGTSVKTFIPGFRANSTKLTRPMKRAIRDFISANPGLSTVTCKGFTSAPATAQDMALARQRGKVTCDFIKKIKPELEVKVLKGSHTNTPGQQIRRVRIVME